MRFSYTPKRLMEEAENIAKRHPLIDETRAITPDDKLKELIKWVVSADQQKVKVIAAALSDIEICEIAGYIPHNYYNVDLNNLVLVILYRPIPSCFITLYHEWQNNFCTEESNRCIDDILDKCESFRISLSKSNVSVAMFHQILILDETSIPAKFGLECEQAVSPNYFRFSDLMKYFDVQADSALYKACYECFYTFCLKKDYLSDVNYLGYWIQSQTVQYIQLFLFRFLRLFSLSELTNYFNHICEPLIKRVGEPNSQNCKQIFLGAPAETWQKYRNWINAYKLGRYIHDDRLEFWRQYESLDITHYYISDSIVIEFDNYCVVEFLGTAMGPLYVYEKDKFCKNIYRLMNHNNNQEIRGLLFHNPYRKYCTLRKEHRGSWQNDMNVYILMHDIAKRIEWNKI